MADVRIKDLDQIGYNGDFLIAVDNTVSGTRSMALSELAGTTYSFAGGTNCFTVSPSGGTAQIVPVTPSVDCATSADAGLMSSTDKQKLDGLNLSVCTQTQYDVGPVLPGVFYFIKES